MLLGQRWVQNQEKVQCQQMGGHSSGPQHGYAEGQEEVYLIGAAVCHCGICCLYTTVKIEADQPTIDELPGRWRGYGWSLPPPPSCL